MNTASLICNLFVFIVTVLLTLRFAESLMDMLPSIVYGGGIWLNSYKQKCKGQ